MEPLWSILYSLSHGLDTSLSKKPFIELRVLLMFLYTWMKRSALLIHWKQDKCLVGDVTRRLLNLDDLMSLAQLYRRTHLQSWWRIKKKKIVYKKCQNFASNHSRTRGSVDAWENAHRRLSLNILLKNNTCNCED